MHFSKFLVLSKAEHVIKYLGQYTHRVAISNQRIIEVNDTHVRFGAKDYRDNARQKITQLKGVDFLRRFCNHIMPLRFVRIRKYGIYNHIVKRNLDLQFIAEPKLTIDNIIESKEKESRAECIIRLTGFDYRECPHCKKGKMIVLEEIPRIRSPPTKLNVLLQGLFY